MTFWVWGAIIHLGTPSSVFRINPVVIEAQSNRVLNKHLILYAISSAKDLLFVCLFLIRHTQLAQGLLLAVFSGISSGRANRTISVVPEMDIGSKVYIAQFSTVLSLQTSVKM